MSYLIPGSVKNLNKLEKLTWVLKTSSFPYAYILCLQFLVTIVREVLISGAQLYIIANVSEGI